MYRPTPTRGRPVRMAGLLLLAGLLLWGLPAAAQAIKVTSAVPDMADQGTLGLLVTVGGENFGQNSKVKFYVTGTKDPGGITVKSVKYKNSKTLEATIDVAADAQTQLKFDIEVTSGSRTGKGTELFKVNVKQTGGDTTPPGTVTDLQAVQIGFNTAVLNWMAPADDGYLSGSGPVANYAIRVRRGWSPETPNCGPYTASVWGTDPDSAYDDPCNSGGYVNNQPPASPGTTQTITIGYLKPDSVYWAMVRSQDDATPTGNWSAIADDVLHQTSFTTGSFPPPPITSPWTAGVVDVCRDTDGCSAYSLSYPRFDFDAAGNPVMLYVKENLPKLATWTGGGWQAETVGAVIDTANWAYDLAFDPNGVASIASYTTSGLRFYRRINGTSDPWDAETVSTAGARYVVLRFNPVDSAPTIAYVYSKGAKSLLRLVEKRGGSWTSQEVSSNAWRTQGLAFDGLGNPAVAFVQEVNGVNRLGVARRVNGAWTVEVPDSGPGYPWTPIPSLTLAFDESRNDFSAACKFEDGANPFNYRVRFCERTSGAWTCQTVDEGYLVSGPAVSIGADGTVYFAYAPVPTLFVAVRKPGETAWNREYADWNAYVTRPDMRLGPNGQPGVAYNGAHDEPGVGPFEPVCFARRTSQ